VWEGLQRGLQGHLGNNGWTCHTVHELWLFENHYSGPSGGPGTTGDSKPQGLAVRGELSLGGGGTENIVWEELGLKF
jgi:hypothetical protein